MILSLGLPVYINFLKLILSMARDSFRGFRQVYPTFLYGHKKYNRGSGSKRTNGQYGLRSAPSARRVVLWHFLVQLFVHLGRIFFAKLLQKPLAMPTHLWLVSSAPLSTASLRLPSPIDPFWVSLPTAPLASNGPPSPNFRSCRRSRVQVLCLVSR